MSRRAVQAVAVAAILLGLLLNFDSLLLHLGSRLPGSEAQSALALLGAWWPAHKLALPDGLVVHSFIGAPQLSDHLRNLPVLPSVLFSVLRPVAGPVAAFNLVLLLSQVATQGLLFALLLRERLPALWAGLAALAFVFSPWYSAAVGGADVIAASLWTLPLALLAWEGWLRRPSTWRAVWVALALYAGVLCGVQHSLWIAALWLPYALYTGRGAWREAAAREQLSLAVLILLVLLLLYPLPDFVRALQGNEPAYAPVLGEPVRRSLIGWALRLSPAILLVAAITVFRGRRERGAIVWLALAGYLSLAGFGLLPDPLQAVFGGLGLPFRPLADREFLFGPALIAWLLCAGHAWREELASAPASLRWRGAGAGLLLIVLGTNSAVIRSIPQHAVTVAGFYRDIAADPEDYLVLEYPFGLSSVEDGREVGQAAYLARDSVWDGKRSVSGLAPYIEPMVFDQVQQESFLFPDTVDDRDAAAQALGEAVNEWRIGYVVVHPDLLGAAEQDTLRDLAERSSALCPPVERDGLVIYRARWHPAGCDAP
jgi:hypothetical protein